MCAPRVMGTVKEEISRRRALGLLAAPAVAGAMVQSAGAQAESLLSGDFKNLYDLTHVLSPSVPVFPVVRPMELVEAFTIANEGFFGYDLTLNEHTGTHMDAPNHFSEGGLSVDQLQPRQLFAPLAVIDIRARAARDVDTSVTVDDLRAWERQHGELPPGAFVAMNSGWDSRVGSSEQFVNADAQGVMHFPGFSAEAAHFLNDERNIVGIGSDTLSLDVGTSTDFVAHRTLLPSGKYGVELVANLESVPAAGATIIVGAPKHAGGSGGPVRLFAVS